MGEGRKVEGRSSLNFSCTNLATSTTSIIGSAGRYLTDGKPIGNSSGLVRNGRGGILRNTRLPSHIGRQSAQEGRSVSTTVNKGTRMT